MSDPAGDAPFRSDAEGEPTDAARGLAWALYLGASWTWVIGMFLPVLLIRDFGPAAWFIFAVPNVVGAAAMGWALRSADHSARLVDNHRVATQVFSLVTIAFHFFFLVWLIPQLIGTAWASVAFGVALLMVARVFTTSIHVTLLAAVPLGASLVIAMLAAGRGSLGWPDVPARGTAMELVALAAVCGLGFLTCPYLDLTFNRARQACRTPGEARIAFGVGFGVAFLAMIVFTLLYAGNLASDRVLGALVGIHICVQAIFTVGIHASALRAMGEHHSRLILWASIGLAACVGLAAIGFDVRGARLGPLGVGEVLYRGFMSYYGLVAPAYVWLCVHPARGFLRPRRRELQVATLAVVLAAPFYWVGFIAGPMTWVLPGVAIVVLARLAVDYSRRDHLAEQRAAMTANHTPIAVRSEVSNRS